MANHIVSNDFYFADIIERGLLRYRNEVNSGEYTNISKKYRNMRER